MPDSSPTPLTNQALARLRKLADGNGLAPEKIEPIETQEKIYAIEGITQLMPFCERGGGHYAGPVRGKGRQVQPDFASLHAEAERHQRGFLENRDWVSNVVGEIKAADGQGWGLDGAKVTLPEKSVILAASETCPTCQGQQLLTCGQCQAQGFVICTHCQGQGQEFCANCNGTGQNPQQPGQPCVICNGQRTTPCRFCRATGKLVCPTCQGRRGTPCSGCQGTGRLTQEIALACGATINFRLSGEGLPSGLRRGLDRLGIANLPKGHADITLEASPAAPEKKDGGKETDASILRYRAMLPYADLKLRFGGGRAVMVSVFGKKALLMGVPAFLDDALKPWRERLERAARGAVPLEDALKARAMKEALALEAGGRGQADNLRRSYSIGLSPAVAREIMLNMKKALHRFTRHVRIAAAIGGGLASAGLLAGFFTTPFRAQMALNWPWWAQLFGDTAMLGLALALGWTALGASSKFMLKRRFPDLKISLRRDTGMIGYMLLTGIALAWLAAALLAPVKPLWLVEILRALKL